MVKRAIAAQQDRQLKSVEVRIEDVLHDLRAIAHTDLQTLTDQSGVPARWGDKLKALELLMKHLGLAAPETHQHVHQHVHFTMEQLQRMTDDQLDRSEAAYKTLATIEKEVAADEARRETTSIIDELCSGSWKVSPALGLGWDARRTEKRLTAGALLVEDHPVHLAAFSRS